jgi:hypothetical protein
MSPEADIEMRPSERPLCAITGSGWFTRSAQRWGAVCFNQPCCRRWNSSASFALNDDGVVVGALVSMLPHLAIAGPVIPSRGLFEGGKLKNDHAFGRRTLEYFLPAIAGARCNGVPRQRGRDLLRIGVKLRLVAGSLARED